MSDMMMFPDSVEEFMNQYKVVDTEQVYTNGAELVPIFRMKQWFEHLPSAQRTGRWIYYPLASGYPKSTAVHLFSVCSECGCEHPIANYCPNCGAKMEEEDGNQS